MSPVSLGPLVTPALLSSLRSHPRLPQNSWYFVAGVTLSVLNRPDQIPYIFRYALENGTGPGEDKPLGDEEGLHVARRLRESLIKSSAVVGLPKTINALHALKTATPPNLLDGPSSPLISPSPTLRSTDLTQIPIPSILQRGQAFFDRVYGKISHRVMGQMDRCGTEDLGLVARLEYGYLLSAGMNVLDEKETSFVLLAGLIPQDVNPQLKGHLKGAVNNGATVDEVRAVREVVVGLCEEAGMKMLGEEAAGGWGWRDEVADLRTEPRTAREQKL